MERWPSGLRRTPGTRVECKLSQVQILSSPHMKRTKSPFFATLLEEPENSYMKDRKQVVQFVLFQTLTVGSIGVVLGIVYSFGGALLDGVTSGLNEGTLLAFGALIGMPLLFAVAGFLLGAFQFAFFGKWLSKMFEKN